MIWGGEPSTADGGQAANDAAVGAWGEVSTSEDEEKRTHIPMVVMTSLLLPIVQSVVFFIGGGGVKMCCTIDP